jgi:hypothetical protein
MAIGAPTCARLAYSKDAVNQPSGAFYRLPFSAFPRSRVDEEGYIVSHLIEIRQAQSDYRQVFGSELQTLCEDGVMIGIVPK